MSRGRGGRGGFGGRGGTWGGNGKQRIGGQEVSWDYDPELVIETKPQEMFPEINIPELPPPTTAEKAAAARFVALRRRIREGPLYTVLGTGELSMRGGKARTAAEFNPFDDMTTYTQKYRVGVRKLPRFEGRRYQLRFFPAELWDTVDPISAAKRPKPVPKQSIRRAQAAAGEKEVNTEEVEGQKMKKEVDDVDNVEEDGAGGEDGVGAEDGAEGEENEENPEDDFSEDDSEMGADYNAENYFDAGDEDDDIGGDLDGGDDGGFD